MLIRPARPDDRAAVLAIIRPVIESLDLARSRGYRAMQFNFVVGTNRRAVALWQAMGFRIVGRLPRAVEHPDHGFVDALVMFQEL